MPNLEAQAAWVPVREIGIEFAQGGPNGNMNEQAKALLARTEFLNQQKASKSEIVQGHYEFNTYAEFNAIKSTLPLNCTVIINEMPTGTQTWGQGTNRWNGTTLTKSAYDPLAQAKADATTKANAAEANAKAYADKLENYVLRKQKYLDDLRLKNSTKPKAAVVVLLGQSLAAPRNTNPILINKAAPIAKMPVGGASIMAWDFYPTNPLIVGNVKEVASAVDYVEEVGQTPAIGIINAMAGGKFAKLYVANVAIPARTIEVLMSDGPVTNLNAVLHALCKAARTDGYDPQVMFYSAHGEANAAAGTTEQAYYDLAVEYYGRAQLYAAQAMQKPDYVAPIVLTYPLENVYNSGENDRIIKSAIKRIVSDMPKVIDLGGIYQWEASSDRTHPTPKGYIQRGEAVGKALFEFFDKSSFVDHLEIVDVTLSGTTFIATFNHQIVRDTTIGAGQNLAVGLAKDGLEWIDNGTQIAITELIYGGRKITGTLASAPVGTLEQQVLRVAEQTVPAASAVGAENNAGSVIRADKSGWSSIFDATYINHTWAIPQKFTKVRSV